MTDVTTTLVEKGYYIFNQEVSDVQVEIAKSMCCDTSYERGRSFKSNFKDAKFDPIRSLVVNDTLREIFLSLGCPPREIFITNEFLNDATSRNNYLHFDRLRSYKVLVYMTDVLEVTSGAFTIVENSHKDGKRLRLNNNAINEYALKKNRIDVDYPDYQYVLKPILGKRGTTIIFDSDIFHFGGRVKQESSRLVIRSHWYPDFKWRNNST